MLYYPIYTAMQFFDGEDTMAGSGSLSIGHEPYAGLADGGEAVGFSIRDKAAIMRDAVRRGCYAETVIGQDSVEYDERLDAVVHWALEGDGFAWVASDDFLADIYDDVRNGFVQDGDEAWAFVSGSEDAYRGGSFGYAPAEHEGEPIFDDETGDYVDWAREAVARYEAAHAMDIGPEDAMGAYGFDDGGFSDEDDGMEDDGEGLPY